MTRQEIQDARLKEIWKSMKAEFSAAELADLRMSAIEHLLDNEREIFTARKWIAVEE